MKLVRRTLMGIGAIVLIASLMNVVAPKAVHAAVAALVQVVNTPTTAVPTVAAPAASQLYQSQCASTYNGSSQAVCNFAPPVPAGQTLFVESASILSQSPPGADPTIGGFFPVAGPVNVAIPMVQQATVPNLFDSFVGVLTGRLWFKAGETPACLVYLNKATGGSGFTGIIQCTISGYLAPAQ